MHNFCIFVAGNAAHRQTDICISFRLSPIWVSDICISFFICISFPCMSHIFSRMVWTPKLLLSVFVVLAIPGSCRGPPPRVPSRPAPGRWWWWGRRRCWRRRRGRRRRRPRRRWPSRCGTEAAGRSPRKWSPWNSAGHCTDTTDQHTLLIHQQPHSFSHYINFKHTFVNPPPTYFIFKGFPPTLPS